MKKIMSFRKKLFFLPLLATGLPSAAHAYVYNFPSGWMVSLNTNMGYSLGIRADKMNGKIGNNPAFQEQEWKHPDVGDITNNRVDVSTELNINYNNEYGIDASVSGWKDFAYNGGIANNPDPAIAAYASAPNGHYPSFTNHYYNLGAELGNAYVYANTAIEQMPLSIKIGRFVEYWGTALFSGAQAISYGQEPLDFVKALNAPGSEVKTLFLPRNQISIHLQPSAAWTLGVQYQLEWRPYNLPQGGTWLSFGDMVFNGPQSILGNYTRGKDSTPPDVNGNFGVEALYSPLWLNGTAGLYFRQFDDPAPYAAYTTYKIGNQTYFHNAFAQHVHLYGASLEHSIGPVAATIESSIRTDTALLTASGFTNAAGTDGARGDIWNVVADSMYTLTPSPFWDTGSLTTEVGYSHLLGVTHGKQWYMADKSAICGSQVQGCATNNEANFNVAFDPQWLGVIQNIDVDMPVNLNVGFWGGGQTLMSSGNGYQAGTLAYSAGFHALIRQKYNVQLIYSGYSSPTSGVKTGPGGKTIYSGGDGPWFWNDQSRVLLSMSTAF